MILKRNRFSNSSDMYLYNFVYVAKELFALSYIILTVIRSDKGPYETLLNYTILLQFCGVLGLVVFKERVVAITTFFAISFLLGILAFVLLSLYILPVTYIIIFLPALVFTTVVHMELKKKVVLTPKVVNNDTE